MISTRTRAEDGWAQGSQGSRAPLSHAVLSPSRRHSSKGWCLKTASSPPRGTKLEGGACTAPPRPAYLSSPQPNAFSRPSPSFWPAPWVHMGPRRRRAGARRVPSEQALARNAVGQKWRWPEMALARKTALTAEAHLAPAPPAAPPLVGAPAARARAAGGAARPARGPEAGSRTPRPCWPRQR
eukprot:SAG25_NODE_2086_length_1970_cov_2.027258_2_plen_183_part_00